MIEYVTNHPQGTIIYQTDIVKIEKKGLLHTMNLWCMKQLFTYEGYRKAVQHELHFNHLIPLYLSEDLQLIPIKRYRDYDNLYVNTKAVEHVEVHEDQLCLTFISERKIYIKMSLYRYNKLIEKLLIIRNTKVKHFH